MNPSITDFLIAATVAGLAALGGALMVFSEYDDAPGGVLIGMLLVAIAAVVGWKALQRRGKTVPGA